MKTCKQGSTLISGREVFLKSVGVEAKMFSEELLILARELRNVIGWCSRYAWYADERVHVASGLEGDERVSWRSDVIRPFYGSSEEVAEVLGNSGPELWSEYVERVRGRRANLVDSGQSRGVDEVSGRLMLYESWRTRFCGAAEEETDGFFDPADAPPWDVWLMYFIDQDVLVSWVPERLVWFVDGGMDMMPTSAARWFQDETTHTRINMSFKVWGLPEIRWV